MAPPDLTTPAILRALRGGGPLTFGQLIMATHANRNTLMTAVRRLVARGALVASGPDNRRVYDLPQASGRRRSLLIAGQGDRHETCTRYLACLRAWRGFGAAHCPTDCAGYVSVDRRAEVDGYAAARMEAA